MARRSSRMPRQASNQALMRELSKEFGPIHSPPPESVTPGKLASLAAESSLLQDLYVGKDIHRRLAIPLASRALERWGQAEVVRLARRFWQAPNAEQSYGFYPNRLHPLGLRTLTYAVLRDLESGKPEEKLGTQFHPARQAAYIVASEALVVTSGDEAQIQNYDSYRVEPYSKESALRAAGWPPAYQYGIDDGFEEAPDTFLEVGDY